MKRKLNDTLSNIQIKKKSSKNDFKANLIRTIYIIVNFNLVMIIVYLYYLANNNNNNNNTTSNINTNTNNSNINIINNNISSIITINNLTYM